MNNINHLKTMIGLLLVTGFYASTSSAGMVNGTHWIIKPGDSLYKISRTVFPGDAKKQQQFRKELVSQNPQVFKSGASNISVGDKLQLPSFAITKKKLSSPVVVKPTISKPVATKKVEAIAKTTPEKKPQRTNTTAQNSKDVIGQVVINVGELSAENRGAVRQLNRRSKILRGDTLSTGSESHTQIRLKDGALLSLRPYTNLKIADYRYNGRQDGTEQSIIELLKGGFRTITGAIGHINKQNYKIKTSVATIGIRGTHYSLVMCDAGCRDDSGKKVKAGLYGSVSDGAVVVENKTGIHRFNNDQFFQVISNRARPIEFLKPPGILKSSPRKFAKAKGKAKDKKIAKAKKKLKKIKKMLSHRDRSHSRHPVNPEPNLPNPQAPLPVADLNTTTAPVSAPAPQKAPNGSATLIGFNHLDGTGAITGTAAPVLISDTSSNEVLVRDNVLADNTIAGKIPYAITEFSDDPVLGLIKHELTMASSTGDPATLVPSSLGSNPALGVNWGRWNGQYTVLEDGTPLTTKDDLHFIYSENATSPTQLSNLGGLGANISYSLYGGTAPTDDTGTLLAMPTIDMSVDFAAQKIASYNVQTGAYQGGAVDILFTDLNRSFNIQSAAGACANTAGCSGEASIAFVGANAEGAMNAYFIKDNAGALPAITGTALLVRP